ncbi:MAG: N-acetylglucosamine kinase [Acidobacteriaceae bacterium]
MQYFLAADAGGTKTEYVLADETRELARVQGATIKRLRVGPEVARQNLESALNQLAAQAGVRLQSVTRTCIGTSGASVPLVADWIRETVHSLVSGELEVCGDDEIALDAAFQGRRGVLAIAGTGSNVVGRASTGKLTNAGGWGPMLAEEGSGYRIGHQALRKSFQAINERQPTLLIEEILKFWNLATLADLVEKANASPTPDFTQLTPIVLACAERGDAVATAVLREAGEELAHLVVLVIQHVREMEAPEELPLPAVAVVGSIFQHVKPVFHAMVAALHRTYPEIEVRPEVVDATLGALWRARQGKR